MTASVFKDDRHAALLVEDKLSYVNVAVASHYHRLGEHRPNSTVVLRQDLVRSFTREMVQGRVDHLKSPEPYFMFTLLFWPSPVTDRCSTLAWQDSKKLRVHFLKAIY